jgi:hypothetical protein
VIFMTLNVKAGTAKEVCGHSEGSRKHESRDYSTETKEQILAPYPSDDFVAQMEEGFSPGETSQANPFEFPAAVSTKPRTFSEAVEEVVLRFKLMMVACWLPKDYRVLPPQKPMPDPMLVDLNKELQAIARKLWDSYEPLLGAQHPVTVLQVEAPPEEDE